MGCRPINPIEAILQMSRYKLLILPFTLLLIGFNLHASEGVPNILEGHSPVDDLRADFENIDWFNDYNKNIEYWHDTHNKDQEKRGPESLKPVDTPIGGRPGSHGALEMSRIDDPWQQEMLSPAFKNKLGRALKREDQPIFIVRIYLPPFDQWGDAYHFGFRQQTYAKGIEKVIPEAKDDKYSTSIWVKKDGKKISFYFRAANVQPNDQPGGPAVKPGWWTWAIAFDKNGIGHYYISEGTASPTKDDEVFDTTKFQPSNNPHMEEIEYSYFAIARGGGNPKFVIDDYEVWVKKPLEE